MKSFLSYLFVAFLFVCTTVSGVSGQGFNIHMNYWNTTVRAGEGTDVSRMYIAVNEDMSTVSISLLIMPFGSNATDHMGRCNIGSDVKVYNTNGQLIRTGNIQDQMDHVPYWYTQSLHAGDTIRLNNLAMFADCAPVGLNGEGYAIEILVEGTNNSGSDTLSTSGILIFAHPTDEADFISRGNSGWVPQTNTVFCEYSLDTYGAILHEEAVYAKSPSGITYYGPGLAEPTEGSGILGFDLDNFTNIQTWNDPVLPENGMWTFRYLLWNVQTCDLVVMTDSFQMSGVVGTMEPLETSVSLSPSPAPAGSTITLSTNGEVINQVQVCDMSGRTVMCIQPNAVDDNTYQFSTACISAGKYLVRWSDQTGEYTTRVILIL